MDSGPKKKRRYSEKRRQMSRDAARCRRSNEAHIFTELADALPCSCMSQQLDKASIVRIAITYLKLQRLMSSGLQISDRPVSLTAQDSKFDQFYLKALDGFLMIISKSGEIVYATENVVFYLGISQVEMVGHSIFDLTHPCDHDDIRDLIGDKRRHTIASLVNRETKAHYDIFIRMKSNQLSKANFSTIKSASYRVVHCCGHTMPVNNSSMSSYVLLTGHLIAHPSISDLYLDSQTFVTHHNMDMTITYCDKHIHSLVKYKADQLIGKSLYSFHHALDGELLEKAFRTLFTKGQVITGPYRFLASGGGYAWLDTQATIVGKSSPNDKAQHVICVNNVISDIEDLDLMLSEVQLLTAADRTVIEAEDDSTTHTLEIDIKEDIDDEEVVEEEDDEEYEDDEDASNEVEMGRTSGRMQLTTEMIVQQFTRNISTASLNGDGANGFGGSDLIEKYQSLAGHHELGTHRELQTIPSNNSLFTLLDNLQQTEFEERAPWISMDDMSFGDSDYTTSSASILDSDSQLQSRSSNSVFFTSGNEEEESGIFEAISSEREEEAAKVPRLSRIAPSDKTTISSSMSMPTAVASHNNKKPASATGGARPCSSILMNLLVAGKDVNFGYQLEANAGGSVPVELHRMLCSSSNRVF